MDRTSLKLLSWNIWIENHFDDVKAFLQTAQADIIGLQEAKDDDPERDVIGFLTQLGYHHVFGPVEKTWGGKVYRDGPAVFSRYPIVSSHVTLLSKEHTRAAVRADVDVNGRVLSIFSTHLLHTHQQPSEVQGEQVRTLRELIPPKNAIVMGDFNATPESAAIRLMTERMVDTNPASSPTWSVYPEGCSGCLPGAVNTRLDYIFTTHDLQTHDFSVGTSKGSDHLPVSVLVDL